MDFRSHLARPMDVRRPSNLIVGVIALVATVIALILWLNGEPADLFLAPLYAFLIWSLMREIDPDHDWSALVAAALAAGWVLAGGVVSSAFAMGGLVVAARIVTSTTGRRPLPFDMMAAAAIGVVIGFTLEGWAAGFGIAVAIYLDDRLSNEHRLFAVGACAVTAVGSTVVATAAGVFPETVPDVIQYLAIVAGAAALVILVRDPATPISQVDARHAAFIDKVRLHASRSVVGVAAFLMTVLTGNEGEGMVVIIAALCLAVLSNEIELLRRRRQ